MAKSAIPDMLDAALSFIRTNATKMVACTGQPLTFADANTTMKLAEITMAPADFTLANGVTSGRRVTVAAKANVAVTTAGTANHVALVDVAGSRLLYVTTAPAQTLAAASTVSFGTWDIEINNPA
jgi:urease beta subunit